MNETMQLLRDHTSIRKFKSTPVTEEAVNAIVQCAQGASTSNFIQAYSIIRVISPTKRQRIAAVAGNQQHVIDSPLFLVFCADLRRAEAACARQDKAMAAGYTEGFIVATVDAALAAQNALVAAESLGMGGVYIGGIRNDPAAICEILDIPKQVYPVFGMCLGYPMESPGAKERLPLHVTLKIDSYADDDPEAIASYDECIHTYYRQRDAGKRDDNWTKQISNMMCQPQRPHMKEFLKDQGFLLK